MVPLLLRKEARGGGKAATSYCFVSFRYDQRALRSPFGNLRPLLIGLYRTQRWQVAAALSAAVTTIPKTRNRAQLTWERKSEETHKPIPSYSSGEGVWGRGASLREAASPPESPTPKRLFGREREGGGFSTEKPPPSQSPTIHLLIHQSAPLHGYEAGVAENEPLVDETDAEENAEGDAEDFGLQETGNAEKGF